MNVDKDKFGNEEVDEVQGELVNLAHVIARAQGANRKIVERRNKFSEDNVHKWKRGAGSNGGDEGDGVEGDAHGVCVAEYALPWITLTPQDDQLFGHVLTR